MADVPTETPYYSLTLLFGAETGLDGIILR